MKLKTRKGAKLELTNNLLTGDTFPIKSYIKNYLGGRWDKKNKGWVIDLGKLEKSLATSNSIGLKVDNSTQASSDYMTYEHFLASAEDPNSDY